MWRKQKNRALYRKASAQIAIITRFKCAIYDFTYKIPTYFYGQSAESPHLAHKNKGIMFVIFYYSAAFKRTIGNHNGCLPAHSAFKPQRAATDSRYGNQHRANQTAYRRYRRNAL